MMSQQKHTILVVDDVGQNIDIMVEALGDSYEVAAARDGESALAAISENRPDLILLDIMMPGMDGFEVCRRLQADDRTRDIPVIFVTARDDIEDEQQGLELGAVDYITKPISPPIVRARIRNHLLLKKQRDQLRESISRLQHQAEILQQKAELGIQAGCLAHDFNNILTGLALVQFLPDYLPDDLPQKKAMLQDVETIRNATGLAMEICKGYTNYLHNIGEEAEPQQIAPLLQALDMFRRNYRGRLDHDIATGLPPVNCKGYQLKRVFVNLFVNACQAVEKTAAPAISLRLWHKTGLVCFSIADNGPGIPADVLPRIFEERFTTRKNGTGLGLFLTKRIMDAHGGAIEVETEPGTGTTFTLSFPAAE